MRPPVSAYCVPLAIASASSMSRAFMTATTGPKISSWAMTAPGATSAKMCGPMK